MLKTSALHCRYKDSLCSTQEVAVEIKASNPIVHRLSWGAGGKAQARWHQVHNRGSVLNPPVDQLASYFDNGRMEDMLHTVRCRN